MGPRDVPGRGAGDRRGDPVKSAPGRRPVDPVDAIWLNMDRPTNPMVIESLMMLDSPLDTERFLRVLQRRVLDRYPVFGQRPVDARLPGALPHWEDDPDFDLDRHVRRATLAAPGGDAALQDYVNQFISTTLERDRPLWEVHLLEGYGAGSAIYTRLHHALADGIALTRVLLSLTDEDPDADLADDLLGESLEVASGEPGSTGLLHTSAQLAELAGSALLHLPHLISPGGVDDAFTLTRQTADIAAKLTFTRNPDSAVAGVAGLRKRAVWAPPIPLSGVVDAGHRTGTTVNDLLVAALAGALATYGREHGHEPVDIPTMVPVNVRPLDEPIPRELGNRFALVLFVLPSALATPFARLAETKRRMDEIKGSPEAALTFGLIRGIGRTGPRLERYLVDFFANKASGVTTNVPGPRAARHLAGSRITSMLGWAPESGNQALGTCIFTYDGFVHVGFKVDTATVADPEALLAAFRVELATLLELAPAARPQGRGRTALTGRRATT